MKNTLYVIYSKDDLEFPEFVAESLDDLSRMSGIKNTTLATYISRGNENVCRIRYAPGEL